MRRVLSIILWGAAIPLLAPGATGGAHAEALVSFAEVLHDRQQLLESACECAMEEWACVELLLQKAPKETTDVACLVAVTEAAAECFMQLHACDEASMTVCAALLDPAVCS